MASYTNRTCHECGVMLPQPQMSEKVIMVEVGKSRQTASGATIAGAVVGNKRAQRAVAGTVFNSGARVYHRKKRVWVCPGCAAQGGAAAAGGGGSALGRLATAALFLIIMIIATALIFGEADAPPPAAGGDIPNAPSPEGAAHDAPRPMPAPRP